MAGVVGRSRQEQVYTQQSRFLFTLPLEQRWFGIDCVSVLETKAQTFKHFECDDVGEATEHIGNKLSWSEDQVKITQPVLLQSFTDEFELPAEKPKTPAAPGTVLQPTEIKLNDEMQSKFRSGVGKLLYLCRWSRPEICNPVRELSRYMTGAGMMHLKAMYRVMNYCVATPNRGKLMKPDRMHHNKDPRDFEFAIKGSSDSDYAKDPIKRRDFYVEI